MGTDKATPNLHNQSVIQSVLPIRGDLGRELFYASYKPDELTPSKDDDLPLQVPKRELFYASPEPDEEVLS